MSDGTSSDHISLSRIYDEWEKTFVPKESTIKEIRRKRGISYEEK